MQNILKVIKEQKRKNLFIGFSIIYFSIKAIQYLKKRNAENKLQKLCNERRHRRDQQILDFQGRFKPHGLSLELQEIILKSTIQELKRHLYDGRFTVTQLVSLFIERTINIAYALEIITEINFDEALSQAKEQDDLIIQDREIIYKYDLFGIPVSVKEMFIQKGFDATIGTAIRLNKPYDYDGVQVTLIKQAKGIIFIRTNVPQLAMTFESVNHIYGRAKNPWNHNRAAGGSSGGEGAILAARCSVVGIGSDIAGSIRIPAAFNGVYGMKPSSGRVSVRGEVEPLGEPRGQINVLVCKGPLARSVDDLIVMLKVLCSSYDNIDPRARDYYWRQVDLKPIPDKKILRIGYFDSLNILQPPQCLVRAVHETVQALQQRGHQLVELKMDDEFQNDLISIFPQFATADGDFRSFRANLGKEKLIGEYQELEDGSVIPNWLKRYALVPLAKLIGQEGLAVLGANTYKLTASEFLLHSAKHQQINLRFLLMMKELDLDGIICPGFGTLAPLHGGARHLSAAAMYCWIWNSLNFPCGSVPVTTVQNEQDTLIRDKENSWDLLYVYMRHHLKGTIGLPVNVQIVSYPFQEEMCLRIMKEVDEAMQFRSKYNYPI